MRTYRIMASGSGYQVNYRNGFWDWVFCDYECIGFHFTIDAAKKCIENHKKRIIHEE